MPPGMICNCLSEFSIFWENSRAHYILLLVNQNHESNMEGIWMAFEYNFITIVTWFLSAETILSFIYKWMQWDVQFSTPMMKYFYILNFQLNVKLMTNAQEGLTWSWSVQQLEITKTHVVSWIFLQISIKATYKFKIIQSMTFDVCITLNWFLICLQ